jgi:hypothetical protein
MEGIMKKCGYWIVGILMLAGCATTPIERRVVDNRTDYPSMWLDPANCGVHSTNLEARAMLGSLAALAQNSYLPLDEEKLCRMEASDSSPKACAEYLSPGEGWKIAGGNGEDSKTGFVYRVYERPALGDGKPSLVFAFRGTDGVSDWVSNFYLRTSVPPPQQREADREVRKWVAEYRPNWNLDTGEGMQGEEVYTVGHSLGGAVAQYIAYTMPRMTAIVFNPSPRTGYAAISPSSYRNPVVCRMRESYEALYTLAGGRVPLVEPNLHACGFVNQKRLTPRLLGSLVSAHRMHSMASALACYAQEGELSPECEEVVREKSKAMPGVACH